MECRCFYTEIVFHRSETPAKTILEWYRVRWQICNVALLTQKLVRIGREFSPWGYVFEGQAPTQ